MFWKKKPMATQMASDSAAIVDALRPKWKMFCETMPFPDDMPLADRIEAFSAPAMAGMFKHYPSTKVAPPGVLWMMIFTAVLESKTHVVADVNAAIAQLEARHAR